MIRKAVLTLALSTAMAISVAYAQPVSTTNTFTRNFSYPPVGLASSETVQINVANLASNPSSGTSASCTGSISFVNGSGATIGTATSFTVASGETSSVSLSYSSTGGTGSRIVIRGIVQLTESRPSTAPCSLRTSLETFDATTGVTHLFVSRGGASLTAVPFGGRNH